MTDAILPLLEPQPADAGLLALDDEIVHLAVSHRVVPLVARFARDEWLRSLAAEVTRVNLAQAGVVQSLDTAMRAAGAHPTWSDGVALAKVAYGTTALRQCDRVVCTVEPGDPVAIDESVWERLGDLRVHRRFGFALEIRERPDASGDPVSFGGPALRCEPLADVVARLRHDEGAWTLCRVADLLWAATRAGDAAAADEARARVRDIAAPIEPHLGRLLETPENVAESMMALAGVGVSDRLCDLGCGTGSLLVAAARAGARCTGVEIDAGLAERARRRVEDAGVADRVEVVVGDALEHDLDGYDVVALYTRLEANLALLPKLRAVVERGGRVVAHDFDLGPWPPSETRVVAGDDGIAHRVFVWRNE